PGGDRRLAVSDPTVVGWDEPVGEDAEPERLQPLPRRAQQPHVLERASAQDDRFGRRLLGAYGRGRSGHCLVEGSRYPCRIPASCGLQVTLCYKLGRCAEDTR